MEKIIIENRTDLPMGEILRLCSRVTESGRISGEGDKKQYSYLSCITIGTKEYCVSASKNKDSDKLIAWIYPEKEKENENSI